jgi:hypothetical protein
LAPLPGLWPSLKLEGAAIPCERARRRIRGVTKEVGGSFVSTHRVLFGEPTEDLDLGFKTEL